MDRLAYEATDPLSNYIPSTTLRQLSTSFRDASLPHFREHVRRTKELCESPVTLEEVLSLKKLFYVILCEGHIISKEQFVPHSDGSIHTSTVDTYDLLRGRSLYVDNRRILWDTSKLEIVRFDLKTVYDVLTKVRECRGEYAKKLMMDDVESASKELSEVPHMLLYYLNGGLSGHDVYNRHESVEEAKGALLEYYGGIPW